MRLSCGVGGGLGLTRGECSRVRVGVAAVDDGGGVGLPVRGCHLSRGRAVGGVVLSAPRGPRRRRDAGRGGLALVAVVGGTDVSFVAGSERVSTVRYAAATPLLVAEHSLAVIVRDSAKLFSTALATTTLG